VDIEAGATRLLLEGRGDGLLTRRPLTRPGSVTERLLSLVGGLAGSVPSKLDQNRYC